MEEPLQQNKINCGLFKRFNKSKEKHVINMYLPLSRLFGFCQNINRVFIGVTHQIKLKRNDFTPMITKTLELKFLK